MKNVKLYNAARTALVALETAIKTEAKANTRLTRGAGRITRMLSNLKLAEAKYEIVHGRKAVAAKPAKKVAKKATKKTAKKSNVVALKVAA